ncbi:MAG TPA: helix-turn-helix domain-containing protein [Solirubrobacteraceae bacterium]|nr:helix-turn-helix domain-containing protein [Solirubrobacteraceae bacterium]
MNLSSQKRPYRMSARAESAAATAERVLAAAWRQFATRPYEEVLLREIADEADVTAQTLHARFGSKEELFTAAYSWFGTQEIERRPPAPTDDVAAAVAQLYDRYEEHGKAILRMLAQEERIPAIARMTGMGRAYHRHWAQTTFAPLLRGLRGNRRGRRLVAITAVTDLLVWRILRLDMKLERPQAERVVVEMIEDPCG